MSPSQSYGSADLPSSAQEIVRGQLRQDETLVWLDRPAPAVLIPLQSTMLLLSLVLLIFGGFTLGFAFIDVFDGRSGSAGFKIAQGMIFIAMGVMFAIGILGPSLRAGWTCYAITDQRAMIVRTFLRTTVLSFPPEAIDEPRRLDRDGGYGHLIFAKRKKPWLLQTRDFNSYTGVGFLRIRDVEKVEGELLKLRAKAAMVSHELDQMPQTAPIP